MTATTMRFGPEWMRKQPAPAKPLATSPPPPSGGLGGQSNGTPAQPGAASYSALVTPHVPPVQGKRDIAHPFKYSRDEMLQVFKDGGGFSKLPIEVERWEGIVREPAGEPVHLRDFTETEKKLHSTSLNSEVRRRQSTDYMAQGDRSKGGPLSSGLGLIGRRRRGDSNGTDYPPLTLPRKSSWSGTPGSLVSPSTTSSRNRMGSGNTFDDVLNGSDTAWGGGKWRVPSGQPFSDRVEEEEEEPQRDLRPLEPKESVHPPSQNAHGTDSHQPREDGPSSSGTSASQNPEHDLDDATIPLSNLNLNTNVCAVHGTDVNGVGGSTADTMDLAKVQWSYVDPSGIVQGPFPGETMQLWHDQHYFTDDLMMKRSDIDTGFMSLLEVKRRAQGKRIFLSPLSNNAPPPGLGHILPGTSLNSLLHRTGVVDSPRQPSPQPYVRSSTLDSFMIAGSTTTGSASPSSSFGGGSMARGPLSPDPIAVGGRLQRLTSDVPLNGRTSAAGSYSSNDSPAAPQVVRHILNEPLQPNCSSFDVPSTTPWKMLQVNGMQGWNGPPDVAQLGQQNRFDQFVSSSIGHSTFARDSLPYAMVAGPAPVDPFLSSSTPLHGIYGRPEHAEFQPDVPICGLEQGMNDPSLQSKNTPQQQQTSLPRVSTAFNRDFEKESTPSVASPDVGNVQDQARTEQLPPVSPWGASHPTDAPRPRPFDAGVPTSSNTFIVSLPQSSTGTIPKTDARSQDLCRSGLQTNGQESQVQLTEEPQSLTTANVTQHNEQQGLLTAQTCNVLLTAEGDKSTRVTIDTAETMHATAITSQPSASVASPTKKPSAPTQPASKRKASAAAAVSSPEQTPPTNAVPAAKASAPVSAPQKAAWATDDDAKAKQTPAPTNLREIQEAERKRQEARKNAEKERERVARAVAAVSSTEEVQFTASWGLPTSQVGVRTNGVPATKDIPAVSPATTSVHVWTNAAKPVAKTMKEIQEEEERRKRVAKEKETIASAVKRAAQAPSIKTSTTNAQQTAGPWTVVGTSGKHQTVASVTAARPTPVTVTQTSTPNVVPVRLAGVANTLRSVSAAMVTKSASSTLKAEDEPTAPSLEFMKWMRESLRGLNSSVQFEEIAQMLLFFPLDPDDATKELIAETVYGASTTLDGRRFTQDFIMKRKEDVLSRSRGGRDQAAVGRAALLVDVVKAQPKQTQNDFGAFKVVKKKNKRP